MYSGYAFMLLKPLQKDLAEQLQIRPANKEPLHSKTSKEITVGLLDGQYSNRIDILHFENVVDLSSGQQFKNRSASIYKFSDFMLKSRKLCYMDLVFEKTIVISGKIIN
jgi:hypothetical protein